MITKSNKLLIKNSTAKPKPGATKLTKLPNIEDNIEIIKFNITFAILHHMDAKNDDSCSCFLGRSFFMFKFDCKDLLEL